MVLDCIPFSALLPRGLLQALTIYYPDYYEGLPSCHLFARCFPLLSGKNNIFQIQDQSCHSSLKTLQQLPRQVWPFMALTRQALPVSGCANNADSCVTPWTHGAFQDFMHILSCDQPTALVSCGSQ